MALEGVVAEGGLVTTELPTASWTMIRLAAS